MPNDNRYHMPIINRDGNLHFYKVLHDSLLTQKDTVHPCTVILGFGTDVPHEIFDFVLQGYYTPFFSICQRKCENSLFSFFMQFHFFMNIQWKFNFGVKIQSSGMGIWFLWKCTILGWDICLIDTRNDENEKCRKKFEFSIDKMRFLIYNRSS